MSIMLDLRQAVIHKVHGKDKEGLREMIEGSIDAQEAALPGLGVMFEIIWKNIDQTKQDELLAILNQQLAQMEIKPLK
ncbi:MULTISPECIES: small acid-soluble spore protein SspI [unclassified Paenibacillus]|uniref:small acid-soluble spore protein SspI n=1 Tax=unclassified Paenibacillus TaxID=185978 RepID=UPI000837E62A|nr:MULTISPECIES: small acid-soluble spore protein SspI [unclassified Paenibacillus]NWL88715.1 small acid-soluble spore protein SspI [Paenibacillus sp. 79R4]